MMIEEIRFNKKENIFLNKKLFQIENELNLKDKEIRDINKNIIKYDLNKIKNGQSAVEQVEKMKKNYIKKESNYVLTIYQMENELKQLSELLNKNEIDKKSLEELKTKYHLIKDELDKNKADFKEYEFQNEKKLILLTQYNSELSQKINNLENEIKFAKKKENEYAEQIIVHKSKIDYLNKIINQKEISLSQLKTEIKKLTELQMDKKLEIANTIFVPNK
jgi:chromosome segregation ATPase